MQRFSWFVSQARPFLQYSQTTVTPFSLSKLASRPSFFRPNATPKLSRFTSRSYSSYPSGSNLPGGGARRAIWVCIGINTAVFAGWQYALPNTYLGASSHLDLARFLSSNFILSLEHVEAGRVWTVITSAFSQAGLGHYAANMISMYAFGSVLSYAPGFAAGHIYSLVLGASIAGSLAFLAHSSSKGRTQTRRTVVGASGAVMGLGAAACCVSPRATMLLYGFIPIPIWGIMLGYFVLDNYMLNNPNSRTASSSHLGGFAFGVLYYVLKLRRFGGILR